MKILCHLAYNTLDPICMILFICRRYHQTLFHFIQLLKYLRENEKRCHYYHNYNSNRIKLSFHNFCMVFTSTWTTLQIFYGSNHQNELTILFFIPIIATFMFAQSIIKGKLPLFYCYIRLFMYVENIFFKEKWILMYLHFA